MIKKKSLKKEILQLLILFSIALIVTIGVLSIVNQYKTKIEATKHNQNQVLKQVTKEVENLVDKIQKISIYVSSNYKEDGSLLKNIVETNQNISSILILDNSGVITDFYAVSNLNIHKGFDFSKKEYFKKLKKQNTYWSSVFLSTVDEEASISYSFKMNGKIGVFIINLSELSDFMLRFKNHDNSHMIRIFDNSGIIIVNPDNRQLVLQRYNASSSEVFTKLINIEKPYEQVIFSLLESSGKQFGAYSKVKETNWRILVRESHEYILESLTSIIIYFLIAIIFFILISIYFSFKISKRVFTSFDDMQRITSNIAEGHYNMKLNDLYYDELNRLLDSFNKMQEQIDKREDNLENSLNSFKTLFNSTMESIVLTKNGIIVDVNDITAKLFEVDSKEPFIGKNMMEFISPDYRDLVKDNLNRSTEPYEVELIRPNGQTFPVLVQGKFLEFKGEEVRLTAAIDLTELKQKEKLLLQQSKMASMGEMLGNIAHQWRQPLNTISTYASGTKFEKEFGILEDEKFYDSMDMIVENSKYLSRTIDDFRNFFKPDKASELFIVGEIVQNALTLLRSTLKNNEIEIRTKYLVDDFEFKGHPNEFIQVVLNIINNSKDAFVLNGIERKVIEIEEIKTLSTYELHIRDNAGGIPSDILEKIFDPYFTTKHKTQGTGIGLYMSHQIVVDHMRGDLKVKNIKMDIDDELMNGCDFIIELKTN